MGVVESKSAVTPLSFKNSTAAWLDLWNEVHYVSELPLVPKIRAVKLDRSKKIFVLIVNRTFFSIVQLWRLVFLEPVGVQRHTVPHFKGLINVDWKSSSSRSWQYFFLALRPLEKSHFTPIKGQGCDIRFPSLYIYRNQFKSGKKSKKQVF